MLKNNTNKQCLELLQMSIGFYIDWAENIQQNILQRIVEKKFSLMKITL